MTLRLGSVRTVVISSAEAARDAFKSAASNDLFLSGRPQLYATSVLFYGRDIAFMPYGDTWRRMRMACISNLLNPRRVESFRAVREEEVTAVFNHVASACSRNAVLDFSELALRHVNNVVCRVAFGRKFNDGSGCGRPLKDILTETQAVLMAFCVSDYFPGMGWVDVFTGLKRRVWKNFRELDRFLDDVIRSHLQVTNNDAQEGMECKTASKDDNFVTQLLRLHNDSAFGEAFGCMDSVKGVLMDVFSAGTETSVALLVWTMTELIRNPKVLEKAQNEMRSQTRTLNTIIDETMIPNLNYLRMIIKESLRLHPPAPLLLQREISESIQIRSYVIPKNTRVIINARDIGRDPRYWENPNQFNPDRFLEKDHDVEFKGQHFQLIPFGVGRRICPGINFSLTFVEIMLANLLYWFDWRLPNEVHANDLDMEAAPGITMHKKTPLLLKVSKWVN